MNKQRPTSTKRARNLRGTSTDAERLLWHCLRNRQLNGIKFRRQQPVEPYFVDFYCADRQLGIELDGGGHYEPTKMAADVRRTRYLERHGLRVLRFTNLDVLHHLEVVLEVIWAACDDAPSPRPSPLQGRGRARST